MLLSSVAEGVYWMSRYVERAENTVPLILANHNLLLDMPRAMKLGWEPLVAIMGCGKAFGRAFWTPPGRLTNVPPPGPRAGVRQGGAAIPAPGRSVPARLAFA